MDYFDTLVRYETRLWNHIERSLRDHDTISLAQLSALRIVHSRDNCRVQEIADDLVITVGAASKIVDRLAAAGLVERTPHPSDRRSTLLALTPTGDEARLEASKVVDNALKAHLAGAEAAQITQAIETLAALDESLKARA